MESAIVQFIAVRGTYLMQSSTEVVLGLLLRTCISFGRSQVLVLKQ